MAEIMFEEFKVPAFYIANTGVLNAYVFSFSLLEDSHDDFLRFAAGKGSALVIDVGQTMASITPVVDGFVLRKGRINSRSKLRAFLIFFQDFHIPRYQGLFKHKHAIS